jgi:dTMP kinase
MAWKLPNSLPGGLFLTLEGGEGSGKSTLIGSLKDFLEAEGYRVRLTREPGGPPIAEAIRAILLDPEHRGMDPLTELFLYLASRRQNLMESILPALERGEAVISDRYADASVAYQGGGRGLGLERVDGLNREAIGNKLPDLTFFLDLDPAAGLARGPGLSEAGTGQGDRIEREHLEFHRRVRDAYREWAERHPERIRILDASRPAADVAAAAIEDLRVLLRKRARGS